MFVDLPWKINNDVLSDFFDVIPLNISFLFYLKIAISLLSLKKYKVLLYTRGVRYNRVFNSGADGEFCDRGGPDI